MRTGFRFELAVLALVGVSGVVAAQQLAPPLIEPAGGNPYAELLDPPSVAPSTPIDLGPPVIPLPESEPLPEPPVAAPPVQVPTDVPPPAVEAPAPAAVGPIMEASATLDAPLEPAEPEYVWYQPAYWFGPAPWDSGVEIGMNGASGTSESFSMRAGGFLKRKADDYKFDGSLYYNKTNTNGEDVQSNALLDLRYDWLFDDSPWTLFVLSQTFYDEFQAFDINFNLNAGFGYQWIDTETTKFGTSVGTGTSREFGGPGSEWVQEASFGLKFERQLGENRKFYAKTDFFPEWQDFNNHRLLTDVGFEFELHQPSNMSLKLSATDRYDSEPQGAEPHNLNYSVLLIWKL